MVIDLTREMLVSSVISRLARAIVELSAIAKIHKYKRLCEGHHFIPMAMEVHIAPRRDMDRFIKEHVRLFHDRQSGSHLSLVFCIQFFKQHVSIAFQCALAFAIERKFVLASDACSNLPLLLYFMICMLVTLEGP